MKNPPRFLLINHKGCHYCQDAEIVLDPKGPLIGYAWFEDLQAENARLRKAGDAMALCLANGDRMEYGDPAELIEEYMNRKEITDWLAAKEGKPSA